VLFIVFEGIDRSGKSTQSKKLVETLKAAGVDAIPRRFPERSTTVGGLIDAYLQRKSETEDHAIHLLFSANRWELKETIKKELLAGKTVVCDRYAYSGVAFSSAKGLDIEWCKNPDRGLLRPDLVLFVDLSVDEALKRGQFGEERYEKDDFQRKVAEKFQQLRESSWHVLDGKLEEEVLARQVEALAVGAIGDAISKPLAEDLWTL